MQHEYPRTIHSYTGDPIWVSIQYSMNQKYLSDYYTEFKYSPEKVRFPVWLNSKFKEEGLNIETDHSSSKYSESVYSLTFMDEESYIMLMLQHA